MTVELVIFRSRPNVTDQALVAAANAIRPVLARLPGFVRYEQGKSEDGRWMDLVHWRDLASAKSASEAVMQDDTCRAYFALIDESSIDMHHFELRG